MEDMTEDMHEADRELFEQFRKKTNAELARAQVSKLELDLCDPVAEKGFLKHACREANRLEIGAVCVYPSSIKACVNFLGDDPQASLIACISSPHGGDATPIKVDAVKRAVKDGVDETEVTAPIAQIKDGNWGYVRREFKKLKSAGKVRPVRINIESNLLSAQEIAKVCSVAADCGITALCAGSTAYGEVPQETVSRIRASVKDRCTLKVCGASDLTGLTAALNTGAESVGSKKALELAELILKKAEN